MYIKNITQSVTIKHNHNAHCTVQISVKISHLRLIPAFSGLNIFRCPTSFNLHTFSRDSASYSIDFTKAFEWNVSLTGWRTIAGGRALTPPFRAGADAHGIWERTMTWAYKNLITNYQNHMTSGGCSCALSSARAETGYALWRGRSYLWAWRNLITSIERQFTKYANRLV